MNDGKWDACERWLFYFQTFALGAANWLELCLVRASKRARNSLMSTEPGLLNVWMMSIINYSGEQWIWLMAPNEQLFNPFLCAFTFHQHFPHRVHKKHVGLKMMWCQKLWILWALSLCLQDGVQTAASIFYFKATARTEVLGILESTEISCVLIFMFFHPRHN